MNIFVCSHGNFAEELVNSAEMIVGKMSDVSSFCLQPHMSMEEFSAQIEEKILIHKKDDNNSEFLAFVDLFGGTPCIATSTLTKKYNMLVVTGVNLPMLLEIETLKNSCTVDELLEVVKTTYNNSLHIIREGIRNE